MASVATYRIVAVMDNGATVETKVQGAPGNSRLISYAKHKKASFVMRFYPTRKGWMLFDVRDAKLVNGGSARFWAGYYRLERVFPTEDAAIMTAYHLTHAQHKLL